MKKSKIYVVEGIRDEELLKKLDPNILTIRTNGFSYNVELINQLVELEKTYEIIIVTDPDFPGRKIRDSISQKLSNPIHVFIPKELAISISKKKVGLEHVNILDLSSILNHEIILNDNQKTKLKASDLNELKLTGDINSANLREIVTKHLHLPISNAKRLLEYINKMGITYYELEEIINER